MFSTKSVNSLRRLFAGYHEPLPLSKQQSQKLLDGLKSSFRNQLDREYGQSPTNDPPASIPLPPPAKESADHHVRHSAASAHLRSILSNPLFSYTKESIPSAPSLPHRDPMDVFDHAVSKGMMTLNAATGCLNAKRREAPSADAGTALRIVRWLRSSGAENDLGFLDDKPFIRALTPCLVAESMEAVAWEWIVRAMKASQDDARVRRASYLLSQLVQIKSQAQYGNLDAAIQTILDAERLFEHDPMLPQLLVKPWRSISWLSTVEWYSRTAPSEELFDAHMAVADRLQTPLPVEKAHLHLHHPTHPNHIPALRFFGDVETLRELASSLDTRAKKSAVRWITFLGHDTVNHLKQSGRNEEAMSVTELLRREMSGIFAADLSPT